MRRFLLSLLAGLVLGLAGGAATGRAEGDLSIAAAANLVYVLEPLNAAFTQEEPAVKVTAQTAASGTLVAQIANGAPYDVFLSADLDYPRKLIALAGAPADSLTTFALGRLALWSLKPGVDVSSVEAVVNNPAVLKLALANPRVAPYGRAAEEVLAKLGLTERAAPKLVYGENITQAAQYVSSGNADAGLVALSLVLSPKLKERGHWLEVPADLYAPIAQGAVLTKRGADNPAARRYLKFLTSPAAQRVFAQFGYGPP